MRWSKNTINIRPRVPIGKLAAIREFVTQQGATFVVTSELAGLVTIETRGLNPARNRQIDRFLSSGEPLTKELVSAPHFGGKRGRYFL